MIGKVLNNRYKISKKIGTGGMAIVYLAKDQLLERDVAIKILQQQFADNQDAIEQFTHEARAVARFSHPNIVNIFDIGQSDDIYYIVMEYITGMDLKEKIAKESRLSIQEAVDKVESISKALIKAHQNNIIHCDIKPHNILITADGRVKVTDFGIAQAITDATMAQTDTIIGSAHYLSPEQAKGSKVTIRSDIYSLGVLLYELVTGEVPFKGENSVSVALKHIEEVVTPPSEINQAISKSLEDVILKAMAKEPQDRYNSVAEFLKELKEVKLTKTDDDSQVDINNQKTLILSSEEREEELKKIRRENREKQELKQDQDSSREQDLVDTNTGFESEDLFDNQKPDFKRYDEEDYLLEDDFDDDFSESSDWEMNKETKANNSTAKKILKVLGILAAILAVILGVGYYLLLNYLTVAEVEVPNLVGRDLELAENMLESRGLRLDIYHKTHNNEIDKDHIISQSPDAGSEVKQNRNISVVVSEGPQLTKVPSLEGKSFRDARIEINSLNLFIGEQIREYSDEYDEDVIIKQEPEAEKEVATNTEIDLVISRGAEPQDTEVPDLLGLDREDAIQLLRDANLLAGDIRERDSLEYRAGIVMEQEPEPDSEIKEGSTINLVVSAGIRNPYNADINTSTVRTYVPPGRARTVEIVVEDDNGRRVVYEEVHEAQSRVEKEVITVGSAVIRVYMDGNLNQERRI